MSQEKRDYYEVLGVDKSATEADIKKAYRKLAKENHPDLHPNDREAAEARFKEINEAYEVLSNSEKKAKYDQFGHAGVDPNFSAGSSGFDSDGFGGFGDIFSDLFGGGFGDIFGSASSRNPNAPQRGENIRSSVSITFEEAAFGCTKEISATRIETCETCGGNGCERGFTAEVCSECHGTGTVRVQRRTAMGMFATTTACSKCGGTGKFILHPCKSCKGSGLNRRQRKISVNIPAGIDDGQTISLRGQGNSGKNGGTNGDLLVTVSVSSHQLFQRDGTSVLCEIPITFAQAALGAELEVPTLDGKVKYTIPEGTQTNTVFRLRDKGIPYLNGRGRGDQYVTVKIETPRNLTFEQKELIRKLGESFGEKNHVQRENFFNKLKKKK